MNYFTLLNLFKGPYLLFLIFMKIIEEGDQNKVQKIEDIKYGKTFPSIANNAHINKILDKYYDF